MESVAELDQEIGNRVKEIRVTRGLTLDALARRSGVSRAMLSRIERGESSPTAQLLNRVCIGLGVTLSRLFADANIPPSPVRRHDDQPVWRDPGSGYIRRNISPPGTGSPAEIIDVEFPAGATVAFDAQQLAGADQQIWIRDGQMELTVGETMHRLGTGDCLYMRFGEPIVFHNPFDRPARYVVVISRGGPQP